MTHRNRSSRRGFTLIELMVVIMIIGILSAFGIPQYLKALENNKAEDGASITNMVATANRMYALDNGTLASGTLASDCSGNCVQNGTACDLVRCKYLAAMDFDNYAYTIKVGATCGAGMAACSTRSNDTSHGGTDSSPYKSWGYSVTTNGVMSSQGGAPTPTQ